MFFLPCGGADHHQAMIAHEFDPICVRQSTQALLPIRQWTVPVTWTSDAVAVLPLLHDTCAFKCHAC